MGHHTTRRYLSYGCSCPVHPIPLFVVVHLCRQRPLPRSREKKSQRWDRGECRNWREWNPSFFIWEKVVLSILSLLFLRFSRKISQDEITSYVFLSVVVVVVFVKWWSFINDIVLWFERYIFPLPFLPLFWGVLLFFSTPTPSYPFFLLTTSTYFFSHTLPFLTS